MHLILTHEQADFDAMASLLGAWRLNEQGLALAPRKMNRNVRAFIALYGADLPFTDPRDLPAEPVESVTLVDTQSMITVKGMGHSTPVHVIDHHARRVSTPKEWRMTVLETGATTTHFVELLQEHYEAITPIQATLLMLGIYEDTGSLTYSHTTPRDVRAAAWLMESGASLQLAAPYLNPPLSEDQRNAYHVLVGSAETLQIEGLRILIAKADLPELLDEVSSLAHKLRDLFDPDALFVLVESPDGVRIVARSSTDRLDVAAVTAHFGGGGHERAAAALVHRPSRARLAKSDTKYSLLEKTVNELTGVLHEHVRPVITVAQLMSRRPRTLPPDTTAQEAAKMMQKYGYEGFPVLSDGHVIGLLTRRAVDRAISHRLNLNASSLMDAGQIMVKSSDSLQHLQVVMASSGWGQVPVADESGKLIGIVTRTDLLKILAPSTGSGGRNVLKDRLEKELPPGQRAILHAIEVQATQMRIPVYVVGGFVRDFLLNRGSPDFDIVVEGNAISLARQLAENYGGRITAHNRFGTAKWQLGARALESLNITKSERSRVPAFVDFITARLEFYEHPAALPGVEHASIRHDLHRRDFTINTLAIRLDGHHFGDLHDYYGGLADLEDGLVRVLHSLSFVDDPTRMLRAVRYEQRYGFTIESRTIQLMEDARLLIAHLSSERIRHELDLTLGELRAVNMLSRLNELDLLDSILDVLPWNDEIGTRLKRILNKSIPAGWEIAPPAGNVPVMQALGYALWLEDLTMNELDAVQARLRFPAALLRILRATIALKLDLPRLIGAKPSQWTFRLDGVPRLAIYAVFESLNRSRTQQAARTALEAYVLDWRCIHPLTNGDVLKALNLPPGPRYQTILDQLRAAWLDGQIDSPEQETVLLKELLVTEFGSLTEEP